MPVSFKDKIQGAITNADNASSVPWNGVTGKPSTFAPSSHSHKYASGFSVNGETVTVSYGDGTTSTFTTQDTNTTYGAASTSAAGLMSAADKSKLDGIAAGANKYSHPTGSGNNHIPAGGSSGQILRWSAAGTAVWGNDNNTTYSVATQSVAGLMSAADKKKLDTQVCTYISSDTITGETKSTCDYIDGGSY